MSIALFALAHALSLPRASTQQANAIEALYRNVKGTAGAVMDAVVRPDGSVQSCTTLSTAGDAQLAASLCLALQRIRVIPGVFEDGTPAYGVYRTKVMVTEGNGFNERLSRQLPWPGDGITVQVNRLPDKIEVGLPVRFALRVEPDGKPSRCIGPETVPEGLASAVCRSIGNMAMPIITGKDGGAVPYVGFMNAFFELKSPPK